MSKGPGRRYKSLFLSALVFPGVGHLYLKRYGRGALLLAITMAGLAVIVIAMVEKAMVIMARLQQGDLPLDVDSLSRLLESSDKGHTGLAVDIAGYAVLLCWLLGMIDAYRLGKRQDQMDHAAPSGGREG